MLQRIKTYYQIFPKFNIAFVVAHVLAVLLMKFHKKVEVNPWRIVWLMLRHAGYKKLKNIEDIIETLRQYGLRIKADGKRRKIYLAKALEIEHKKHYQYVGKMPLIGVTQAGLAVVIFGIYPENPTEYVVINSTSKKGYGHMEKDYFHKFYLISNYFDL